MCGRFVTIITYEELREIFNLIEAEPRPEPCYSVALTQLVPQTRHVPKLSPSRLI